MTASRKLVFVVLVTASISAISADEKHGSATRIDSALVIDGRLDEAAWAQAKVIESFYQQRPNEYATPSHPMRIRVLYNDDTLYISAEMQDSEPDRIVAQVTRQGAGIGPDDNLTIFLDGFNSRQSGYIFGLNPNGVRNEGLVNNDGSFNLDWGGIWDGAATKTEDGWVAELAIPFRSLSFDPTASTWSFNAYRYIARLDEVVAWVSRNQSQDAASAGSLSGFEGLELGTGLDVVPGLTTRTVRNFDPDDTEQHIEPSVDLFYKPNAGLNLALTINTDFSATEVDDRQVGLSQFSLFFPERREFFLRDANVFEFGGIGGRTDFANYSGSERQNSRPFFSRRIGLGTDGAPVDLNVGAKVSGKNGPIEFGILAAHQDGFDTVDAETLAVGRVRADIFEESSIGAIATYGDPTTNSSNHLLGVDFRYRNSRLGPGKRLEVDAWAQQTDNGTPDDDTAFGLQIALPNSVGWRAVAQYQRVQDNFDPGLGFTSRTGVELKRGYVGYIRRLEDHPWLQLWHVGSQHRQWSYLDDGSEQSSQGNLSLNLQSNTGGSLFVGLLRFGEQIRFGDGQPLEDAGVVLPIGQYRWTRLGFRLETPTFRALSLDLRYFDGGYYSGDREVIATELSWRPNRHWRIQSDFQYWDAELPEGDFILRLATVRVEWAANSTLSWTNVAQYDNISGVLGINSRLHWTPRAGQDIFLVLGHTMIEDDERDEFSSLSRDIAVKASYTFRF